MSYFHNITEMKWLSVRQQVHSVLDQKLVIFPPFFWLCKVCQFVFGLETRPKIHAERCSKAAFTDCWCVCSKQNISAWPGWFWWECVAEERREQQSPGTVWIPHLTYQLQQFPQLLQIKAEVIVSHTQDLNFPHWLWSSKLPGPCAPSCSKLAVMEPGLFKYTNVWSL